MPIDSREGAGDGKLSLLKLDLFLKGELDPAEMEDVRKRVAADADAARYLREAQAQRHGGTWADVDARLRASKPRTGSARPRTFKGISPRLSPGWALAAAACLALVAAFWILHPTPKAENPGPLAVHSPKGGNGRFEVRLELAGRSLEPGTVGRLRDGESVKLQYRSLEPRYVRVRIQADEGKAEDLDLGNGASFGPATRWSGIPLRVPAGKEWRRIRIWVVSSLAPVGERETTRTIANASSERSDHVALFQLEAASP